MKSARRCLLVGAVFAGLLFAGWAHFEHWVTDTRLPNLSLETSPEIRDRNGHLLRAYTVADGRWRLAADPATVSPLLQKMLLSYEDKRFQHHIGVDPFALLRATAQSLRHGQVISGGSTLTMQVARLLENSGTGRWPGKIRQIRLALALERKLSKSEVLQLYLTLAPYGGNLEGIRAASLSYFGKEPAYLTPAEAALLVAIPQSPNARRPHIHPETAKRARDRVLSIMRKRRVISDQAHQAAVATAMPRSRRAFAAHAPHLSDRIRRTTLLSQHNLSKHKKVTTLDARLQVQAERLARRTAEHVREEVSVAMLVADHQSGEILASVGAPAYGSDVARQSYIDMTQAIRSPGSTLKPLIYALAFDQGLAHPQTIIPDARVTYEGGYTPVNFDGRYRGDVTLEDALKHSLNTPVVQLLHDIGPARLVANMRRAGMQPEFEGKPGLAIALGGVGVRLEGLVQLYALLAQGGRGVALHWDPESPAKPLGPLLSPRAAWMVSDILINIAPPPGRPSGKLAYKTGTSYGHRDTWALGYDGQHVAGVWIGRPDGTPVPGALGANTAAPVLFDLFQRIKPGFVPLPAAPDDTLIATTAQLPQPLRRFVPRNLAMGSRSPDHPVIAFPPDGARMALNSSEEGAARLPVKLRQGRPPFVWLLDGVPIMAKSYRRVEHLPVRPEGFSEIVVIDAQGRSASSSVWLEKQ